MGLLFISLVMRHLHSRIESLQKWTSHSLGKCYKRLQKVTNINRLRPLDQRDQCWALINTLCVFMYGIAFHHLKAALLTPVNFWMLPTTILKVPMVATISLEPCSPIWRGCRPFEGLQYLPAAIITGWRRPIRERKRSDQAPIIGSLMPSQIIEMAIARPVSVPDKPSTCL